MANHSPFRSFCRALLVIWSLGSALAGVSASAQQPDSTSNTQPDVLIFVDGEKLLGRLVQSDGKTVTFKSDMAGEIKVEWSKIKELHSPRQFAVIENNFSLRKHENPDSIPQGVLSMSNQTLQLESSSASAQKTIPVPDAQHVVGEPAFQKAAEGQHNIFQDWKGAATAGVSLVKATQNNETYTSAVSLVRIFPTVEWMNPVNRTIIDFTSSYGKLTQVGTPSVKTSIFHADAERDEYFTPRLYTFVGAAFDHNYSQGLDLEQSYGGGLGWTLTSGPKDQVDLKAELDYVSQAYETSSQNQNLIGSVFSEGYNHLFRYGILLHQTLSYSPAWSNTNAYSASGDVNLKMPIFKRISVTLDTLDTFLNNPSPGFKKNSFQFSTGITYSLP